MHVECGQSYVDATPNDEPIESVKYYISVMMEMPQHCLEFWVGDHVIMEDNRLINSYFSSEESDMYTVYVLDKRSNRLTYLFRGNSRRRQHLLSAMSKLLTLNSISAEAVHGLYPATYTTNITADFKNKSSSGWSDDEATLCNY
ncbi:hypothetical protein EDC05_006056 [Coemansia umbellata]|uniref:Uncharacterized protein n=1 Tax=Coemansia umbellata TaxID=1424467 RepID=A0ABQ8PFT6_9FUNG|nr:hypothetical protein EDC05_006056 [Coemansia umbellata]